MSSPLMNTIKSFWTPEKSNDPEFLRLIRQDKGIFLLMVGAGIVAGAGVIATVIGLVTTLT